LLFSIPKGKREEFFVIYRQFGLAPSKLRQPWSTSFCWHCEQKRNIWETTSRRFTTKHKSKFDGPHFQATTVNILTIFALIFVLFILLGRAGEAWEPYNKMMLLLPSKRKCLLRLPYFTISSDYPPRLTSLRLPSGQTPVFTLTSGLNSRTINSHLLCPVPY